MKTEGLILDKDQWRKDKDFIPPNQDLCENLIIQPAPHVGDAWDGMLTCFWPTAKKYLWKDGSWRQWGHIGTDNGGYFNDISEIVKILALQGICLEEIKEDASKDSRGLH